MIESRHGQMGTTIAPEVSWRIGDFLCRTERERRALFRLHLHTTVHLTSPLLLDLAEIEEIDLPQAVADIEPPQGWPRRPSYDFPPAMLRAPRTIKGRLGKVGNRESWRFSRMFDKPGVILRQIDHPKGRFAIRPFGNMLGFSAEIDGCLLNVFGAVAMIKIPQVVPESVMISLEGRRLNQIVEHHAFKAHDYVIDGAVANDGEASTTIFFSSELAPLSLSFSSP